jgi:hypothetical protein
MILCIQVSKRTKEEMDRLLEIGQYTDYSEAVAVSVSNQVLLHDDAVARAGLRVQAKPPRTSKDHPHRENGHEGTTDETAPRIPVLFSPIAVDPVGVKVADLPCNTISFGDEVSVDQWIFGQHNKLLPVKATCRALANLLLRTTTSHEGVPLSKAASEIAGEAVILGDFLRQADTAYGIPRDDTLAFAFPRSDSTNSDKSRLRFASQFVGSVNSQGIFTGLPTELKLVNKDDSQTPRLLLTEAGWQLAKLANPVLDGRIDRATNRFGDEESSFLINHIVANVPSESFAFRVVLRAVIAGANTPDTLDDALEQFLPKRQFKPFTRAFLTTQRAGVVSRLSDLGLLRRIRDGIKVTYSTTEKVSSLSQILRIG